MGITRRRTKPPKAIYSSLDDIAAEVLRIAQAPPAAPDGGAAAGEPVKQTQEPGPVPSGSRNGGKSTVTNGAPVSSVEWAWPGAAAKTEASAAQAAKRFLRRRVMEEDLCPGCRQDRLWRVNRDGWMRFLPGSRHLMCDACEARFLTFCGSTLRLA